MKVNHLRLIAPDVSTYCEFLEKYFELRKCGGNPGALGIFTVEVEG